MSSTPFCRVVALGPRRGRSFELDPKIDEEQPMAYLIRRGLLAVGREARIFLGTLDGRLFALDAATGRP